MARPFPICADENFEPGLFRSSSLILASKGDLFMITLFGRLVCGARAHMDTRLLVNQGPATGNRFIRVHHAHSIVALELIEAQGLPSPQPAMSTAKDEVQWQWQG
ncbi:hypothetical protein O181_027551 [Austropuccinia psidii MF-1]|uniref:Uncharacterized protein n=1 Tax=Austropuccinia psidii MF-1 TaxID=1389203 RepID=A0A9Q3CSP8_9BASI|nr:hypothetical protein [Austropuccinia psidii MF-1]